MDPSEPNNPQSQTGVSGWDKASKISELLIAAFAGVMVLMALITFRDTARFNESTVRIQVALATQAEKARLTQASSDAISRATEEAHTERELVMIEVQVYSAQTSVALQDREGMLRETEVALQAFGGPTQDPALMTSTTTALSVSIAEAEAEGAIREYYDLINAGNYAEAWTRLTPRFQLIHSGNSFTSYQGYWMTLDNIQVTQTALIEMTPSLSEIELLVVLKFFQSGWDWDRNYRYAMVRDPLTGQWLIDGTVLQS